ncbi:MAG: methionyl-tRNA formyltransferase [Spirochaetaceae bacterium]|jgi:methionyl-tRNA formyltransferase|nr:methionyl-tRNA formyltransferase [Spirochaetaceae bacterium]
MRILFAGSPEIALPSLEAAAALSLEGVCQLAGILTNPDAPRGRRGVPGPTPVGAAGAALAARFAAAGAPPPALLKPERLGAEAREAAATLRPDLLVCFAYGRIFGPRFLDLFPRGGINIHPSLLPKYRGPTPIPAAILNRDTETGITIQKLAPEMDAGDILVQEGIPLSGRETSAGLSETVAEKSALLLAALLRRLAEGPVEGRPQNHAEATYCSLLTREEGFIDWQAGAEEIDARIRAFTPWPLCLTRHGELELYILRGRPLGNPDTAPSALPAAGPSAPSPALPGTVLGVDKQGGILIQTGNGIFAAERLQYRTRKALEWRDFLNGAKDFIGSRLI